MPTTSGEESFFAPYIDDPGKERLEPEEEAVKQQRKKADPKALLRTLLTDVLANGPAPATIVEERGRAHGFSRKQLFLARQRMNIFAFKEAGKRDGRWYWGLPQHAGYFDTADNT